MKSLVLNFETQWCHDSYSMGGDLVRLAPKSLRTGHGDMNVVIYLWLQRNASMNQTDMIVF